MSSAEQFSEVLHEWLKVFMRRTGQEYKHFMDDSGLSFSQVNTLMRLHFTGQADVSEIGAQMGVTTAAASQLVDHLVRLGLLERTEDLADRRIKRLTLTPAGHALAETLVDTRRKWMEKFTNSLTPEQRDDISKALQVLTEAARKIQD
ncbi:MAG TPA: MarR family transcriptional regulator [Anaerolineales bacterium]|nr:MarR family transcriptional regulator [Anaerolineales bacterium]